MSVHHPEERGGKRCSVWKKLKAKKSGRMTLQKKKDEALDCMEQRKEPPG